jgi:hypothetical protein
LSKIFSSRVVGFSFVPGRIYVVMAFSISSFNREFSAIIEAEVEGLMVSCRCSPPAISGDVDKSVRKVRKFPKMGVRSLSAVGGGVSLELLLMASPLEALLICITAFLAPFLFLLGPWCREASDLFRGKRVVNFFVVMVEEKELEVFGCVIFIEQEVHEVSAAHRLEESVSVLNTRTKFGMKDALDMFPCQAGGIKCYQTRVPRVCQIFEDPSILYHILLPT